MYWMLNLMLKKYEKTNIVKMVYCTDYGHTMAISLILCGPNTNSNPSPKWIFGYKGLVFQRNNGWLMENLDKGQSYIYQVL